MISRTIADLPFDAARRFGDRPALRYRQDGSWRDQSFAELAADVTAIARGLVASGLATGDRVGILGPTCPEWTRLALGVIAAGGVVVPIYPTSSDAEREWIVGNSGAKMVLYPPDLPPMGTADADAELARRRAAIDPAGPCLIIYTSGTTGPPKGCVLTHDNWLAVSRFTEELEYLTAQGLVYLFLPLAHVFAQLVQFGCLSAGATLAYFGGDLSQVVPELAEVRPTFLPSVPRIFEKLHTTLAGRADAATVRAVLGGRLRMALSGAAPIAPEVLEFFRDAGVPVLEGFGMTESTGCGTVSTPQRHRLGTVGVAVPGGSVRIAEDGEVLMAGPHVFAGYWRDPAATREVLVDGWLHTGDLGTLDEDGSSRSPAARRTSSSPRPARTSPRPAWRTGCGSPAGSRRPCSWATAAPTRSR
ncbi:AMP-dependent synthetase/ligase [Actinoplanes subtropicus]|uniref:AMP-dependent synthetase/ligase n=1 Tax=Actinoplanes subtropicus TaxID=543632 RepID=UPI000690C42F|nr:AMP-binding protein [Actinoplanes subtropicus]